MKLHLQRKTEIDNTVLGELYINNKFFCYTLEDKIRKVKIKHETCIPPGTYQIILNLSQRFKIILPLLLGVPNFEHIRIHAGNTINDTSGCLLLGSAISGTTLLHSKTTVQKLVAILTIALKKEYVTIEILNPIKIEKVDKIDIIIPAEPLILIEVSQSEVITPVQTKETRSNLRTLFNQLIQWVIKHF